METYSPFGRIALAPQLLDSSTSIRAIGGLGQPVFTAPGEGDEIVFTVPEQDIRLSTPRVLPFVDHRMGFPVLDHPTYPLDMLASTQIRRSILFRSPFLCEMPERSPPAPGLRDTAASHRQSAKAKAVVGNLLPENAIQCRFVSPPISAEPREGHKVGRLQHTPLLQAPCHDAEFRVMRYCSIGQHFDPKPFPEPCDHCCLADVTAKASARVGECSRQNISYLHDLILV